MVCYECLPVIGGVYAKSYDHTTLTTSRCGSVCCVRESVRERSRNYRFHRPIRPPCPLHNGGGRGGCRAAAAEAGRRSRAVWPLWYFDDAIVENTLVFDFLYFAASEHRARAILPAKVLVLNV